MAVFSNIVTHDCTKDQYWMKKSKTKHRKPSQKTQNLDQICSCECKRNEQVERKAVLALQGISVLFLLSQVIFQ